MYIYGLHCSLLCIHTHTAHSTTTLNCYCWIYVKEKVGGWVGGGKFYRNFLFRFLCFQQNVNALLEVLTCERTIWTYMLIHTSQKKDMKKSEHFETHSTFSFHSSSSYNMYKSSSSFWSLSLAFPFGILHDKNFYHPYTYICVYILEKKISISIHTSV